MGNDHYSQQVVPYVSDRHGGLSCLGWSGREEEKKVDCIEVVETRVGLKVYAII